ncbi:AMP-binding protein [Acholeplasma sp. OttesenSCG-928-E16]|nr:AMP-binding protein [Acholeplasma sp. OttesenSCG-928-E16]
MHPLTSPQKRIIINQEIYPNSKFSYMYGFVEINDKSPFEIKNALNEAISFFDCLRIRFIKSENKIYQKICKYKEKDFLIKDSDYQFHDEIFDLFDDDLYRFFLIDGKKRGYYFIFHHSIIDAYGIALITNYIEKKLTSSEVTIKKHSYLEFINKEEAYLKSKEKEEDDLFFDSILKESKERQYLLRDDISSSRISMEFLKSETDDLLAYSKSLKISVFKVIYAATFLSLFEFFGKENITISTTHHNRGDHEKGLAGMCASTIPLVMSLKKETYSSFLDRFTILLDEAFSRHQFVADDLIHKYSKNDPFVLMPSKFIINSLPFSGLTYPITRFSPNEDVTELNFKLNPNLKPKGSNLEIAVDYSVSTYKEKEIDGILNNIKKYAIKFITKQDDLINIPKKETLMKAIDDSIKNNLESLSLVDDYHKLTYKELDQYSSNVALAIKDEGSLIGLLNERSVYFYVGLLGILKAGKAFVVLSNLHNKNIRDDIIGETKIKTLLKYNEEQSLYELDNEINITKLPNMSSCKSINGDIAYVMYTSGSTGKPKGVIITTPNLLAFYNSINEAYDGLSRSSVLSTCSLDFDGSLIETILALKTGSTLFIASDKIRKDIKLIHNYVCENNIKNLIFTTALGQLYNQLYPDDNIDSLMIAGAKMTYYNEHTKYKVINGYGPAECTVLSHYQIITKKMDEYPFGKPFSSYYERLSYTDENEAELFIIGPNVGLGYLNNYKLTKERFFIDEKTKYKGYKSADIIKQNEYNENIFLTRKDRQIKLNGFRIELDAIDTISKKYQGIKDSYTIYIKNSIIQYVVGKINLNKYKKYLTNNLPYYVSIKKIILAKEIPRGNSDKPNIKINNNDITKKTREKKKLLEIIRQVALEDINYHDDFMNYGINSIELIEMITKIEREFKTSLLITDLYSNPTVNKLYDFIKEGKRTKNITLIKDGNKTPFIIFFDLTGDVASYKNLIDSISDDTPILAINSNNLHRYESVESFCKDISLELLNDYKYDHYTLIGYSGGGTFAFELSRQLGGDNSSVYMIDTPNYALYPIRLRSAIIIALRNCLLVFRLRGYKKMFKYAIKHIKDFFSFKFLSEQKKIMKLLNKYLLYEGKNKYTLFVSSQSAKKYNDQKLGHQQADCKYFTCNHAEIMLKENTDIIINLIKGAKK